MLHKLYTYLVLTAQEIKPRKLSRANRNNNQLSEKKKKERQKEQGWG